MPSDLARATPPHDPPGAAGTAPQPAPFAYDLVHYPDGWHAESHPDRMAVMAALFGLRPAPPDRCRVLELGCGSGWNLLAMAQSAPEAEYVGIDLAAEPIERGRAVADRLGLTNVHLHAGDLMEVSEDLGPFDYIVAHGLYSWVPAPVRDRVMALCRALLAPHGVAYVSYNTYPGKYLSQAAREMMLLSVDDAADPQTRIGQARFLMRFLRDAQHEDGFTRAFYDTTFKRIDGLSDNYIFHDDLADVNDPCYFSQFVAHAQRHGLQYLSEASLYEMNDLHFSDETAAMMRRLAPDHLAWEQLLDFVVMREFRRTLLCHADVGVDRSAGPDRMRGFWIGSPANVDAGGVALSDPAWLGEEVEVAISGYSDAVVNTRSPLLKALAAELGARWPAFVAFDALVDAARARLEGTPAARQTAVEADRAEAAHQLVRLFAARFVALRVRRPPVAIAPGPCPVASPLARFQAGEGLALCNLLGDAIPLQPLDGRLLPLLDGTRDAAALRAALGDAEADGLEPALHRLAESALFVA